MSGLFDPSIRLRIGSAQGRPLWLLNIVLSLIAVLIVGTLVKAWVAPIATIPNPAATRLSPEAAALALNPTTRPPLTQFEVLLEKNPFKQPPPLASQPGPPPIPAPTLVGTVLVDHERKAILNDRGKANIYSVGQEVAGGTVTDIREDRVFYKRGDAVSEITLKAPIQRGAASRQRTPVIPSAPLIVPLPPPPGTVEGAPSR